MSSAGAVLAAGLAAMAGALILPWARRAVPDDARFRSGVTSRPRAWAAAVAAVAMAPFLFSGLRLALVALAAGSAAAVITLVRADRRSRGVARVRSRVVETSEALVGELRAGQPPARALVRCVEVWPAFGPVASAASLGADVPTALRRVAEQPGAEGMADLAAAWQVAERSGAGLAPALDRVAGTARARQNTRHLVSAELSSARATALLVAVLPFGSLALTAGVGGDPWHFLLDTPVGLVCLACGAVLVFAGLAWIDRIAGSVVAR